MSILSKSSSSSDISGTSFLEFKKQASFFFKEKIKTARLALTDVTPAQLLTEEATSGNPWAPDTRTLGSISRAAFELDDYLRIVEILHKRLVRFERKNWRSTYHSLILLERLLTHGPESVAREFQEDTDAIRDIQSFQHIDEKGFNWGLAVRNKSERILKLLENEGLLKEERERSRKLTRGIRGFGSFSERTSSSSPKLGILQQSYGRSNSQFNDDHVDSEENKIVSDDKENLIQKVESSMNKDAIFDMRKNMSFSSVDSVNRSSRLEKVETRLKENMAPNEEEEAVNLLLREEVAVVAEEDHPFSNTEYQTAASSLLSARDGIILQ
ncbi:EPN2 [Linum perenne]